LARPISGLDSCEDEIRAHRLQLHRDLRREKSLATTRSSSWRPSPPSVKTNSSCAMVRRPRNDVGFAAAVVQLAVMRFT
jgi:hypothetical protein